MAITVQGPTGVFQPSYPDIIDKYGVVTNMFTSSFKEYFTSSGAASYSVNKSLRFRSSASAYLNRTFGTPTNNIKWTWSAWVKRGKLGSAGVMFQGYASLATRTALQFNSSDQLVFNGTVATATTTAVFRDPAAWYHIVCVYDSANATAANRLLLYVNGTAQTVTGTQPTASLVEYINGAWLHYISTGYSGAFEYLDEDLAEINFVDGQALAPTAFGASSIYNQWLPIAYAGIYGTNGFYLPFNSVSTSSYAGSFNGSNQYLSMPLNAVLTLGSGNFTVEAWIIKSTSGSGEVFGKTGTVNYAIDCATLPGNNLGITLSSDGLTATTISGATTLATSRWYHVAWVRSGTTVNIYLNGVLDGTGSFSGAIYSGSNVDVSGIGARPGSGISPDTWFNGYISNLRVVKGTAVYTAAFTPPVAPLTAITNTSLLTLQSATIVDNSGNSVSITNNNTVVTSVQYPFTLAIAADSSGNANNWAPNNISLTAGSTYDSLTDVPTLTSTTVANYAVWNAVAAGIDSVIDNGNLRISYGSAATRTGTAATMGMTTGKFYWEVTVTGGSGSMAPVVGISNTTANSSVSSGIGYYPGYTASGWGYEGSTGDKYNNSVNTAYGATYTTNDVIGVAFDATAGSLTFYKNNVSQGVAFSSLPATTYFPAVGDGGSTGTVTYAGNFGQQPFTYTAPSGFLPLNTFNI